MIPDCQRPPVRVAIAGLGRAMFSSHYPVYRAHPSLFKVVAACDLMKERRDMVERDFPSCKMFRRFSDMLDERDIDLVDIATCSVDHAKHAAMSLEHGYWTLLESPAATENDDAQLLRGASAKAKNRLIVLQRGLYAPDYLLALKMISDPRLGGVYRICVRGLDYIRRDDWQTVKRLGGGAARYALPDLMLQTLRLLGTPPVQMWSDLKRVASAGDCEDFVRVCLKTRTHLSAEIEFNGGSIPGAERPSFEIHGERGVFTVMSGQPTGELVCIDPSFQFKRRRSSVRTPDLSDMHEDVPTIKETVCLEKGVLHGPSVFWKHLYDTVRTASPFPVQLEESIEALRISNLTRAASPFGS